MTEPLHPPSAPEVELRRERTFGQVISDTLNVLGSNLTTFLPALFVVIAAPLILMIGVLAVAGPILGGMLAGLAALPLLWALVAATFAYFLLYEDGYFEREASLPASVLWAAMKPLLGPIVGVQLGVAVLFFGPALLIGGGAAALDVWWLAIAVGVVWVVAMIVFLPALSMATPAAVMEGEGAIAAVQRGLALTKEHWGQTFGVYIIASILAAVFGFPFSMGAGFVMVFADGTVGSALYGVLTALGYVGYLVLFGALLVQYFNLVERKEGHRLDARIEEIGVEEDEEPLF